MVSAHLVLAPVGAGKTEFVLNELHHQFEQKPFARIWILVATERQEMALRERLFSHHTNHVFFNIEFFNFSGLYQRILDIAGKPQRLIQLIEKRLLLRHIIQTTPLSVFAPVAHTHGFLHILDNWIRELKQNRVFPDDYLRVAQSPRERDLAQLYQAYQAALIRYHLMDEEGQGWLAVDTLDHHPDLIPKRTGLDAFIVDGFDQFSHTQTDLLAQLARQIPHTLITLTQVTGREATIGRRFSTAQSDLERAFERIGTPLHISQVSASSIAKHADLNHLIHHIFLPNSPKRKLSGGITFLEAPTPTEETAQALRYVKQLLLDGAKPDDILIAVRDWEQYRRPLQTYANKYALPLVLHYDEPLTETPFVMMLMSLLGLSQANFPRRGVFDALRSPYINGAGLSSKDIDVLEAISEHHRVISGREAWIQAIRQASRTHKADIANEDDPDEESSPDYDISLDHASKLEESLSRFFDRITPPPSATTVAYIAWIEHLIGADPIRDVDDDDDDVLPTDDSLKMIANLRAGDPAWLWRDLLAISAFKRCLRDLLLAYTQMQRIIPQDEVLLWEDFYDQLIDTLARVSITPRPNRKGRILATTAVGGRGLPHAHAVILGLSEGIFPATIPQDPLYLESERIRLNLALPNNPIKTQAEARDDEGLFYELICLPTDSLILTRPTLKDGKEWLPSPLWRGAVAVYEDAPTHIQTHKIGIGKTVRLTHAATVDEAYTALAIGLNTGDTNTLSMGAWLVQYHPDAWQMLSESRTIEQARTQKRPTSYNGVLQSERNRAYLKRLLGEHYVWSASRLNDQGVCGFRFFAKYLLKLKERKEPQVGMDVVQRGSLYHAILEAVYSELKKRHIHISPDTLPIAQHILNTIGITILDDAPDRFGFTPSPLWDEEKRNILQKLHLYIQQDFAPDGDFIAETFKLSGARTPYRLEARFGFDDDPFRLPLDQPIGAIRVRGIIDRIDKIDNKLVVMDYKSGSTEIKPTNIGDGRNYQMLIYLKAAEHIAEEGAQVAGGFFWHLGDMRGKGFINLNESKMQTIIQRGIRQLTNQVSASREGNFAVEPNKPEYGGMCVRYCEFNKLCRHARRIDEDEE